MFGKNLQLNPISIFLIFTIMLIIPLPAQADTHTWTGEANSLWSNAGNWAPSGVAFNMDIALIQSGDKPVKLDADIQLLNLTVDCQVTTSGDRNIRKI